MPKKSKRMTKLESDIHNKYLDEFRVSINEKRFYDAHEALEVLWFPRRVENSNEIKLIKGFINASVCLELIKRGKIEQSKKVWSNYLKYRPLLYKVESPFLNKYHQIARCVEATYLGVQ